MRVFGKLIGVQKLKVKENTGWSCGDFTSYWWLKLLVTEINGDWTYSKLSDLLEWISKLCLLFISPPNTKIIGWKKLWDQEMTRVDDHDARIQKIFPGEKDVVQLCLYISQSLILDESSNIFLGFDHYEVNNSFQWKEKLAL